MRDALLLLWNSCFLLDLVHELVGKHLVVVLQCTGLVPGLQ